MLKGNNRLVFNEATMQEIIGFYLRNKMLNSNERMPVVASVGINCDGMFEISLSEPEQQMVQPPPGSIFMSEVKDGSGGM